jgi:uncharacterized membrane protein YphA (DoxX/SURF4 family)
MTTDTIAARPRNNAWTIALWVAQVLLAVVYLMAGFMKLTQPLDALAAMNMAWAPTFPEIFVRFLGLMELAGGLGLVLPAATRVLPFLTPLAAAGLTIVQVGAITLHAVRGETAMTLPLNLVLLALALLILWGRTKKAPITPR